MLTAIVPDGLTLGVQRWTGPIKAVSLIIPTCGPVLLVSVERALPRLTRAILLDITLTRLRSADGARPFELYEQKAKIFILQP